jgi:hypothetical protein
MNWKEFGSGHELSEILFVYRKLPGGTKEIHNKPQSKNIPNTPPAFPPTPP